MKKLESFFLYMCVAVFCEIGLAASLILWTPVVVMCHGLRGAGVFWMHARARHAHILDAIIEATDADFE